jgi:predicted aldo/keto reductase-like oxidoreductase
MHRDGSLDEAQDRRIEADRAELSGTFCRGCGYCLPCPAGIVIHMCARMSLLLRRMPAQQFLEESWQKEMAKIPGCQHCDHCVSHCPYGLNPPVMLEKNYEDYQRFLASSH